MRTIKLFCVLAVLAIPAQADHTESYTFQAKSHNVSAGEAFWQNFWSTLKGQSSPRAADLSVKVLSSSTGKPVQGALVLVGQKKGDPFATNFATTDAEGMAFFNDEALKKGTPLTVTASMQGFGNFSLVGNTNNTVELAIQPATRGRDHSFLQGKLLGFPSGIGSTRLEVGMFIPAFRTESLMNFDPQQIVSSYKVEIDVYGKRLVPGNVVMPRQSKRYGIIPITIDKPEFIMPLPNGLRTHMSGILGSVSIGDASDAVKNKDFLAVLNMTELTHLGFTERMSVRGNDRFDLNAGMELEAKAVKAQFTGVAAKLDAVAISFLDPENDQGDFVPMDVKALKSEEIQNGAGAIKLSVLKQRKPQDKFYVFTGLFDRSQIPEKKMASDSRSLVGSLMPVNSSEMKARFNGFLKPMAAVSVGSGNRDYRFSSAANPSAKLNPDMIIVNIVSQKKNAETQGVTRSILWSAVINGSADRLVLPDLGRAVLPNPDTGNGEEFSWEVLALASGGKKRAKDEELDIQSKLRKLQHVSSLAKKF